MIEKAISCYDYNLRLAAKIWITTAFLGACADAMIRLTLSTSDGFDAGFFVFIYVLVTLASLLFTFWVPFVLACIISLIHKPGQKTQVTVFL